MSKRSYEVLGYASEEAFDACDFTFLDCNITNKRDALGIGNNYLGEYKDGEFYPVVKVQSDDREFIKILQKEDK